MASLGPFQIVLAQGLAVTAPPGGGLGPVTLSPLDPANDRQKFISTKRYFSPVGNAANVLEIVQIDQTKEEPQEGDPIAVVKKNTANADRERFDINGGVVTATEYEDLTFGFGSVVATKVGSPLAQASAKSASVTINNKSGGPVYLSFESLGTNETRTFQIPLGKTLRAIDATGKLVSPTPISITGDPIDLLQSLSVTVSNETAIDVIIKATKGSARNVTIPAGNKNVVVAAAFGEVFEAYDLKDNKLMFTDDYKGGSLDSVLVDEAIELYHVVIPCENTFVNSTAGTISLNFGTASILVDAGKEYKSRVAPGTVYRAKDSKGVDLSLALMGSSAGAYSVTVNDSARYYNISAAPPTPTYSVNLSNTTQYTVRVEVTGTANVFTLAPGSNTPVTLPKGAVLKASVAEGFPIAPETKNISGPETITYTSGIQDITDPQRIAIQSWLPGKIFTILYKASRDGWAPAAFHYLCDTAGPTFIVITTANGSKFGGYTPDSWATVGFGRDKTTFIYTLANPHGIQPTKYALQTTDGILPDQSYGAAFGLGNDIYVSASPNNDNKSYTAFPTSFGPDPSGKKDALFTGAKYYNAVEIEAYKVR